jgi:CBS domain-containing protein
MSGTILVRDIMKKNVKTVRTDDTALDAVKKMNKFYITSVVVTNGGRPVGIITSKNILEMVVEPRLDPYTMLAKEVMSSPLIFVDLYTAVDEAAKIMAEKGIKKLPVIEDGKVVGIVSTSDVISSSPAQLGLMEELLSYTEMNAS